MGGKLGDHQFYLTPQIPQNALLAQSHSLQTDNEYYLPQSLGMAFDSHCVGRIRIYSFWSSANYGKFFPRKWKRWEACYIKTLLYNNHIGANVEEMQPTMTD